MMGEVRKARTNINTSTDLSLPIMPDGVLDHNFSVAVSTNLFVCGLQFFVLLLVHVFVFCLCNCLFVCFNGLTC